MAEAAGAHLRLGNGEQLDNGLRLEAIARIDQLAAVLDLVAVGGPLGARDHGTHAGRGLTLAPGTAGDLISQRVDLAADHLGRDQVADRGRGEQEPEIALAGRKGAEPAVLAQLLQLGQAQLPQAGGGEVARGAGHALPSRTPCRTLEAKCYELGSEYRQDLIRERVEIPDLADRGDRLDKAP
jgi:hypothetical protein